ncbi:MAG: hypothetical protein U0441_38785 [Polyangiaceae bacterium]
MIDGVYARDLGAARLRERLRGEVGSSVDLTIVRGDRVLRVKLVREPLGESKSPPPRRKSASRLETPWRHEGETLPSLRERRERMGRAGRCAARPGVGTKLWIL